MLQPAGNWCTPCRIGACVGRRMSWQQSAPTHCNTDVPALQLLAPHTAGRRNVCSSSSGMLASLGRSASASRVRKSECVASKGQHMMGLLQQAWTTPPECPPCLPRRLAGGTHRHGGLAGRAPGGCQAGRRATAWLGAAGTAARVAVRLPGGHLRSAGPQVGDRPGAWLAVPRGCSHAHACHRAEHRPHSPCGAALLAARYPALGRAPSHRGPCCRPRPALWLPSLTRPPSLLSAVRAGSPSTATST